jgi:hypothetical protein
MAGFVLAVTGGQGGWFAVGLAILLVELAAQLWPGIAFRQSGERSASMMVHVR